MLLTEQTHPGVFSITLNRPEKRNALNIELLDEILYSIEQIHKDTSSRVLIIKGAGPTFCAGMDLNEAKNPQTTHKAVEKISSLLNTIFASPLVTIAEVHGGCVAGGVGIAAACDITIASEETLFRLPEVRRGLVPAIVLSLLRYQLSEKAMREVLLLGENFDSWHAHRIGLVNKVVSRELLSKETETLCQSALNGSPAAIAECKRLIEQFHPHSFKDEIAKALQCHSHMLSHQDAQEGIESFLQKRHPNWIQE